MNIEAEITALKLVLAYALRSGPAITGTVQEVDDIIGEQPDSGAAVRAAVEGLLAECKYVGITRPSAGEGPEARAIREAAGAETSA